MDKVVNAIREQLILSYTQSGRVVPTTVGVVAAALQDALKFSNAEEVHNTFRRARDMADIPTQRVLKEALTNHRQETMPPTRPETLIEDGYVGHRQPTNEERAYIFATQSACGIGPLVDNDREIIAQFEANQKNTEFIEYQRGWLKNYIRKLKIETVKRAERIAKMNGASEMTDEYKSFKSRSTFTVTGEQERAFITCSGEAASNPKVQAEILRIRKGGCDFATAAWTARMLARTY